MSSLFSLGSVSGSVASLQSSIRSSASVKNTLAKQGTMLKSATANSTNSATSGSVRSRKKCIVPNWQGPSCVHALYKLLLGPFDEYLSNTATLKPEPNGTLNNSSSTSNGRHELVLVLEGDLYLVPFPVLRSNEDDSEYLCERFSLMAIPNLSALIQNSGHAGKKKREEGASKVSALVVGKH